MQGKQAKIVSPTQERAILGYLVTTRYPARDRVMFLLSMKAGLRAKEMASLTWAMVTDAQGQVAEVCTCPTAPVKARRGAAPFRCTRTSRRRWSRCKRCAGTWPPPSGRSSSRNGVGDCHRLPCADGFIGSLPR